MLNHGRRGLRQGRPRPKINLMRRPVSQRLMRPFGVVKPEIIGKVRSRRRDRLVIVKINLLVFDRAPKPFDKDVVVHPAAAVHAHLNPLVEKTTSEVLARELRALVRVENLWLRDPERFPQRLQTESAVQGRRKLPGDDIAAVPVQDRYEINESMGETDVGDIGRPRLIRPINRNF